VANGTKLTIRGVTLDNLLVYDDGTVLAAVPLAGGAKRTISTLAPDQAADVSVVGKTVFSWSHEPDSQRGDWFSLWTAPSGLHPQVATHAIAHGNAASNGRHLLYMTRDHSSDPAKPDTIQVWGADADGGHGRALLTFPSETVSVAAILAFAGPYALVAAGGHPSHGSDVRWDVSWFDDGWAKRGTIPHVQLQGLYPRPFETWFWTDAATTEILTVSDDNGSYDVHKLDGSGGFTTAAHAKILGAFLSADGANVFTLDESAFVRTPASADGRGTTIVAASPGAKLSLGAVSTDRAFAAVESIDPTRGGGNGQHPELEFELLVATSGASPPRRTSSSEQTGAPSLGFTRDGRYLLRAGSDGPTSDSVYALPTAGGDERKVAPLGLSRRNAGLQIATGADLVWIGGIGSVTNGSHWNPLGDDPQLQVMAVNVASGLPAAVLAAAAGNLVLTPDATAVVYSSHATPGAEGIYVAPLP
jgi:hypothetical protein